MNPPSTSQPIDANVPPLDETLEKVSQRVRQLEADGEKEDGKNELSQLMAFLRILQQQQQHVQLIQQQFLQNASPEQQQQQIQALQQHLLQQAGGPQVPAGLPPGKGIPNNMFQQMLAYSLLSKNLGSLPNPAIVPQQLPQQQQQQPPPPPPPQSSQQDQPQLSQSQPSAEEPLPSVEEQRRRLGEKLVEAVRKQEKDHRLLMSMKFPDIQLEKHLTPMDLLSGQQRSHAHASRQQRLLLPDFVPAGLAPATVRLERDRRIEQRAQSRLEQLESHIEEDNGQNQPQTLGYLLDQYYKETVMTASSKRLQAIVEIKSLRLREKQAKLRLEVMKGMDEVNRIATSVDKTAYRKLIRQTLREAKMTEKLERQQRQDREKREKQKQLDYLQTVCNQGRELLSFHRGYQARLGKLGKAVLQYHSHVDREEQKRLDRRSKERIRALREDDEEAYMKLIDEAKDTRLTLLLKQTGTYLDSLTRAVVTQQNDPVHTYEEETSEEDLMGGPPDEETMLTDANGNKIDYFRMAHRIQEKVSQPKILSGGKLKEYQVKGLQWMVSLYNNRLNGILADEMGLGKTIQTISLITYLIEKKKQNGPFLIIVPLSTITNWDLEFEKWAPDVNKIVYKGTPEVRKSIHKNRIKNGDFQVLLTTFDYVIKDRPQLSKIKWVYIIIDEGHRMKNTQSKLTMVLRQYYASRYRLILTGTPLQNNLPELWALLNFILPKIFHSVQSFEEWFNTPFSNQGVPDKVELNEEEQLLIIKRLHKVLRPFLLRRLKKDVESELPDKVERVIKCKLSALQARLYSQMKRHGMLFAGDSGGSGRTSIKGLNNTIMQLRKICNHPFVFEEVERMVNPYKITNELLYRTSGKFELLDRILPKLRATGHRVLIFFQMTQIMDIMEDFCLLRDYRHLRLDGSTKSEDRSRLLEVFNAPDSPYFVFLLSTRAGGLGLNLQTADTVIIFDSDWNPHQDLQAQDRAHRIGQTKEVRIFRLITQNSVEETILARAQYKLDIDGKVIQAGKFDHRSTEEDREAFLRSLLEDKADEQDANEENEDLDDEELNLMLKRTDQEYATFTKMDLERQRATAEEWRRHYGDNHPPGAKPERLMQDWELPEIYRTDNEDIADEMTDTAQLGRGQRSREAIKYDDGMTEGQWLRQLERGSSPRKRAGGTPYPGDEGKKRTRLE